MDDTKKLIEKYKRELMELSGKRSEKEEKKPQIIGFAEKENEEKYDSLLSEISGSPNYVTVPSSEQVNSDDTEKSVSDAENGVNSNAPSDAENAGGVTDNNPTSPRADFADAETTTNEQAERLNDLPISGTSPDEQLTGRDFEDPNSPENSPENSPTDNPESGGSRTEAINFPEIVYDNYAEFEKRNIGRGSLIFKIFAGQQSYPIKNAKITVSKKFKNEEFIIAELTTNESGATEPLSLPAPPKELSQGSQDTLRPFSQYNAVVVKNGYSQVDLFNIPIFDGIQSVQNVLMIPEPENEIIEDFTEVQNADR